MRAYIAAGRTNFFEKKRQKNDAQKKNSEKTMSDEKRRFIQDEIKTKMFNLFASARPSL